MRRVIVLSILMFVLTSCASQVDANDLRNQGQIMVDMADRLDIATSQARQMRISDNMATSESLSALAFATSQAISLEQTQTSVSIEATATYIALMSLQDSATATVSAMATNQVRDENTYAMSLETQKAKTQRENMMSGVWSLIFVLIVIGIASVTAWYIKNIIIIQQKQASIVSNNNLIWFTKDGKEVVINPARSFSPVTIVDKEGARQPLLAPSELLQENVTARAQVVEYAQATVLNQKININLPTLTGKMEDEFKPIEEEYINPVPGIADFWKIRDYRGDGFILGLNEKGIIEADTESSPHLLYAGTSGSGKTRFGLRPVITGALMNNWQVAIFDKSGLDFLPFKEHKNCRVMLLDNASDSIGYLISLYKEIQNRFKLLAKSGCSTWSRLPNAGPKIMACFDEFSNLADSLENKDKDELWRRARMIAAEGRKAGVHLAIALQDPSHRSLDLRIRRNMLPIAYRVRDDTASRVILNEGGAEALSSGCFMTLQDMKLVTGRGFSPDDNQIIDILAQRQVAELPEPAWLLTTSDNDIESDEDEDTNATEEDKRILILNDKGLSQRKIEEDVFGYAGGKAHSRVSVVIKGATTTRATGAIA